ncbi:putative methionine aminopeptidase [Filobasidium floriforme]|uniref:putative methionine aminopeptidase n=1 Tax=Filobasidium floriforme TaxID=5210 RepID=UPI001E8E4A64|nr:putative methionine aminopeptidase [Filobasidium floriforme]KAH8087362.1 putative methionine aminopeptidase [Filobasidium floriforme]
MTKCIGCKDKEASRLECPTCKKLGIPGSFFCEQECFKKNWGTHKQVHAFMQSLAAANASAVSSGVDAKGIPTSMSGFKWTGPTRPKYPLSATRVVPPHIVRPDYADHPQGECISEARGAHRNRVLNSTEIEAMRKVCRLTREVLDAIAAHIRPGVTSDELDAICHEECIKRDSYPSPLNYRCFPKSVCISVNEVICHGIPDQRPLVEGDIVNLDVSLYHGGFHGDVNATYPVGQVSEEDATLIATTKEATESAIAMCKPGVLYRDIGNKIESIVKPKGYGIVRQYTAHGINQLFHCAPYPVHYGGSKTPGKMEAGQIFTIEPMINGGVASLDHWRDNWTAVTKDGKKSAQFEETILITETGAEVLTRPGSVIKDGRIVDPVKA